MPQDFLKIKDRQCSNSILMPQIIAFIDAGHSVTILLRGYSMRPFLEHDRDKAVLVKPEKVVAGDVVLAKTEADKYVLHRVVSVNGNYIRLRGDGNIACEFCQLCDVKGKVFGFYRKGRAKMEKTSGLKWKFYSFVWCRLLPIRKYLLAIYKLLCVKNDKH